MGMITIITNYDNPHWKVVLFKVTLKKKKNNLLTFKKLNYEK